MKSFGIIVIVFLVSACTFPLEDNISGNGMVTLRTLSIEPVDYLHISDKIEALLIPSDSLKVVIEADENLQDHIIVGSRNGRLMIYSDKNISVAKACRVRIYADRISAVDVASGARFLVSDTLFGEQFTISSSSAGEVRLTGQFSTLVVSGSSASKIWLKGSSEYLYATLSSAADLNAFGFYAERANVMASSAADASIHVATEAEMNATSAADIRYMGNPAMVKSHSSSAGSVRASM